ncbi:MAG: hypothetical protein A3F11_10455 [Gammaproteobacteria bacterium RIFCSPHIGHO2_12_FULL_37_14]|nr:MAG: hypothetical protein A3F11_10455 [Gammaproteobacteria bacterium RIFCSPHIGHO2_12_FULL_37_14]
MSSPRKRPSTPTLFDNKEESTEENNTDASSWDNCVIVKKERTSKKGHDLFADFNEDQDAVVSMILLVKDIKTFIENQNKLGVSQFTDIGSDKTTGGHLITVRIKRNSIKDLDEDGNIISYEGSKSLYPTRRH